MLIADAEILFVLDVAKNLIAQRHVTKPVHGRPKIQRKVKISRGLWPTRSNAQSAESQLKKTRAATT
jgi:hypothetical protein